MIPSEDTAPSPGLYPLPPQGGTLSIMTLVQQLADGDTACLADVKTTDNYLDSLAKIVATGVVPPLVALLGAQSTAEMQEMTAHALFSLAINADNHAKIAAAGAIPPLVALLGAQSTAAVQEKAAGALYSLAKNADNQVKIAAAGAIPPLVALLGTQNTTAVQEKAAGAL